MMQKLFLHKRPLMNTSFSALFFATAQFAQAATTLANPTPGAGSTLEEFVKMLIDVVQLVALPMLAASIIYAGFILVSAGGNEEKITKGKQWIAWTLVGAAIVLGAQVIADAVFGTISAFK